MTKKKPLFSVTRTLKIPQVFTKYALEGMLVSVFEELNDLQARNKHTGVSVKHPLVVALKRLDRDFNICGGELLERVKPTEKDLLLLAESIPELVSADRKSVV